MYQNLTYPTNVNTRPSFEKSFINTSRCLQNTWRRPPFPYGRRNMMSGRYINVGVRPISHRPNTPMPYKYIPATKYPVPKPPVVINTSIGHRPHFFLLSSNAVGNQINRHMIPVSKNNERKIAVENSAQYGNNLILSNSMTNLPTAIAPTFIQRPLIYSVSSNIYHSQNDQSIFPFVNNSRCQSTTALTNQINGSNFSNAISCSTFQPPTTGIGINYYDTNPAESARNTNGNDYMSKSYEAKQRAIPPKIEQYNKNRVDFQSQNMQDQSFNRNYVNALYSKNLSMTANLVMLPTNIGIAPSQNICNGAPLNISNAPHQNFFLPHTDITQQNIANCDFRSVMPPPVFQNPVVSHNLSSNIVINECNPNVTQNVLSSNNVSEDNSNINYNLLSLTETDHVAERHKSTLTNSNLFFCNPNSIQNSLWTKTNEHNHLATTSKFSTNGTIDFSNNNSSVEISNKSESAANVILINDIKKEPIFDNKNAENLNVTALSSNPSSSIEVKEEISQKFEQNTEKHLNEKLGEMEDVISQSVNTDYYSIDKTKCGSPLNLKKNKQTNKSRPVCSIPVPDTSWCVVWTGDNKVFFYDSKRKLSIWERPAELINRQDVDKMLEKNPVSIDSKDLSMEVCDTSSYHSDVFQKIRKDDQEVASTDSKVNSESKIASAGGNSTSISDACGDSQITQNFKSDSLPREERIKMFCEMLSEKKVSILSSWENEINKVIPDPRYLLLTSEERKEVFTDYIKRNLEDEIIKRRRKYQLQKARFLSLLIEAGVTSQFRFSDITQRFAEDVRFKSFEDMALKESIFNQYVSKLKLDDGEKENNENQQKKELNKIRYAKKSFDNNNLGLQNTSVNEKRYKHINNNYVNKNILKEYSYEKCETIQMAKRQKCINNSLENEEYGVERHLSDYMMNDKKGNEEQKHSNAVIKFKELLLDTIKNSDVSWQTAKKILRADKRWKFSQDLDSETCEHLFAEYASILKYKRIYQLQRFLDILPNSTLKPPWLNTPRSALEDTRSDRYFFYEKNFKS